MSDVVEDVLRDESARSDVVQWGVTAAVIGGPVVFALLGALSPLIWERFGPEWAVGIWVFPTVAYIALLLRATPRSRSILRLVVEYAESRHTISDLERSVADFEASTLVVESSAAHLAANNAIIAEAMLRGISNYGDLEETLTEMLFPLIVDGEVLFGMRYSERWSFSVYLYSVSRGELINVWREKSGTHPGGKRGRPLRPGEGHIGQAFLNERAIITVDATAPAALPLIATPAAKTKPYDVDVYRSFASVPVGPLARGAGSPSGVLVATSDSAGRFFGGNARILEEMAAAIALCLQVTQVDIDRLGQSADAII